MKIDQEVSQGMYYDGHQVALDTVAVLVSTTMDLDPQEDSRPTALRAVRDAVRYALQKGCSIEEIEAEARSTEPGDSVIGGIVAHALRTMLELERWKR